MISLGAAISVTTRPGSCQSSTFGPPPVAADLPAVGDSASGRRCLCRDWRSCLAWDAVQRSGIETLAMTPAASDYPVFGSLGPMAPMFHWHGDSFDLPSRAVGSRRIRRVSESQAFRVGAHAYGVQFHAEATLQLVRI